MQAEEIVINLTEDERRELLMHLVEGFDYRVIDFEGDDQTFFLSTGKHD